MPGPTPRGELTEIRWRFVPPDGPAVVDSSGTDEWKGQMAIGGRIEVSAKLDGEPRSDTATVAVTPREWSGRMPYPAALPREVVEPARFPRLPVVESANGGDTWIDGALGLYAWGIDWFGHFQPIAAGPNKGYWYLREPPEWSAPVVYLSGHLQPGHPSGFLEAQTGRRAGDRDPPHSYAGWCTQADMANLLEQVRDHEGSGAGPLLSHHEFNVQYTGQNDPGPVMEPLVLRPGPSDDFRVLADAIVRSAYQDALEAANTAAVHARTNLPPVTCKVHLP